MSRSMSCISSGWRRPFATLSRRWSASTTTRRASSSRARSQRSAVTKVEAHLASCRDCRALVAALAGDEARLATPRTHKHEKLSPRTRQVAKRPRAVDRRSRRPLPRAVDARRRRHGRRVRRLRPAARSQGRAEAPAREPARAIAKEARTRLKREAQAIAQLSHPNVVGVYDVGTTDDGDVYIAMEFVEGDTLTTWLKRWPRTWREILDVFHQAARGLAAAHAVGLLHRDFKPDNVLVGGDGRVRVTDFGLARSCSTQCVRRADRGRARRSSPTRARCTSISPRPAPCSARRATCRPSSCTGPDIDARADQFSFCVALYEALYGTHPLEGATSVAMLESGATRGAAARGHARADRDRQGGDARARARSQQAVPDDGGADARAAAAAAALAGAVRRDRGGRRSCWSAARPRPW